MNDGVAQKVRRPFWLAFVVSLVLHVAVLTSPGWSLPEDEASEVAPLDATLVMPPRPVPRPAAVPAKPPTPKPRPRPAAPVVPLAENALAMPPAEPAPLAEASSMPAEPQLTREEPAPAVLPAPIYSPDLAARWPAEGRIVFQVTRGEGGLIVGQSEHRWQHDATAYEISAVTETVGLAALFNPAKVVQESRGGFDALGLRPLAFESKRGEKTRDNIRFEPEAQRITFGNGRTVALQPGTQDLLSVFYQLAAVQPDAAAFELTIALGRKLTTYVVSLVASGQLDTPLGVRPVRHYRITAGQKEDSTEVWLDSQSRLPLKIRHRDRKGEVFDQLVMQIDIKETQ